MVAAEHLQLLGKYTDELLFCDGFRRCLWSGQKQYVMF